MILEGPTVRYFYHICLAIIVLRNGLVLNRQKEQDLI